VALILLFDQKKLLNRELQFQVFKDILTGDNILEDGNNIQINSVGCTILK
jgi:hypothetical protein